MLQLYHRSKYDQLLTLWIAKRIVNCMKASITKQFGLIILGITGLCFISVEA
jgi:hypothetical protein